MKIVVAIDSFKGCMTSREANHAAASGLKSMCHNANVVQVAVSDGGEGFIDAIQGAEGWERAEVEVHDPQMRLVKAQYLIDSKTAIVESAQASGLWRVNPEDRNPLLATSYGTGEMVASAIRRGAEEVIVGLGGSATSDAGIGLVQALNDAFPTWKNGRGEVLKKVRFIIATDVNNPLCGVNGAARVFSPQKGATAEMVEQIEERARRFAEASAREMGRDFSGRDGAGAAGGMGYAFMQYLNAERIEGVAMVLKTIRFMELIEGAELIITGEGRADSQTLMGKLPMGVLREAGNIPVALIAGAVEDIKTLQTAGFAIVTCINPPGISMEEATRKDVAMRNVATTVKDIYARIINNNNKA